MVAVNRIYPACRCVLGALFAMGFLSGCGGGGGYEGEPRVAVSGSVTLDGTPLASGTVTFVPTSGGRKANAVVEGGSYSIPENRGPNVGSYVVEIRGFELDSTSVSGEGDEEAVGGEEGAGGEEDVDDSGDSGDGNIVPAKYNTETTLEVEITAGENLHDFPLKSQ